jgi:hypothetical protein
MKTCSLPFLTLFFVLMLDTRDYPPKIHLDNKASGGAQQQQ